MAKIWNEEREKRADRAALGRRGKWAGSEGARPDPARETGRIRGGSGLTAPIGGSLVSRGLRGTRGCPTLSPSHSGSRRIGRLFRGGIHFAHSLSSFRFRSFYRSGSPSRGWQIVRAMDKHGLEKYILSLQIRFSISVYITLPFLPILGN